jgi:hypothetical protein
MQLRKVALQAQKLGLTWWLVSKTSNIPFPALIRIVISDVWNNCSISNLDGWHV